MKNDFLEFLEELNDGAFRKQLSNWLNRVSNDVNVTESKGEIGLKFKLEPHKDVPNVIKLTASITMKTPKNERDKISDSITDDFTVFIHEDKSISTQPETEEGFI